MKPPDQKSPQTIAQLNYARFFINLTKEYNEDWPSDDACCPFYGAVFITSLHELLPETFMKF